MSTTNSYPIDIACTPKAVQHILEKRLPNVEKVLLRIQLKKSGCSGWSYQFAHTQGLKESEVAFTIQEGLSIVIEAQHIQLFKGAVLDYVKSGLRRKLVCINPNEGARCGCGESFMINR